MTSLETKEERNVLQYFRRSFTELQWKDFRLSDAMLTEHWEMKQSLV